MVKPIKLNQKAKANPNVRRAAKNKATKLRKSLTPGTVCIMLTGQFKGCRVVFMKQLNSGLCMVTGPYKVNGVPAKRVNQRTLIATSTKVNVSGVDTKAFTDKTFERASPNTRKTKNEEGFFAKESKKTPVSAEQKKAQASLDAAVMKAMGSDKVLKKYMKSKFALSNGQKPHEMKF
jgi:large subunit ribosomal protein L6e